MLRFVFLLAGMFPTLLTCKNRPRMTYSVLSGTLSLYTTTTLSLPSPIMGKWGSSCMGV